METPIYEIKVAIQIAKPANEIFEAIADPDKMSNYFISKSTGRIEEGTTLTWHFPEFEDGSSVRIGKVEPDKYFSFYWGGEQGQETKTEITLIPKGPEATHIVITETGGSNNESGIKWLKSNTEGWANFLACLKAYLEYGINLRKGAFDYLKAD